MHSASVPSGWPTKRALPLPHSLWLAPVNCWHTLPEHMKGLMTGCVIYSTHCRQGQKQQPLSSLSQALLSRQLLGWILRLALAFLPRLHLWTPGQASQRESHRLIPDGAA